MTESKRPTVGALRKAVREVFARYCAVQDRVQGPDVRHQVRQAIDALADRLEEAERERYTHKESAEQYSIMGSRLEKERDRLQAENERLLSGIASILQDDKCAMGMFTIDALLALPGVQSMMDRRDRRVILRETGGEKGGGRD